MVAHCSSRTFPLVGAQSLVEPQTEHSQVAKQPCLQCFLASEAIEEIVAPSLDNFGKLRLYSVWPAGSDCELLAVLRAVVKLRPADSASYPNGLHFQNDQIGVTFPVFLNRCCAYQRTAYDSLHFCKRLVGVVFVNLPVLAHAS